MFFLVKTVSSGIIIAAVSTVAKRYPGFGGLIASLPLISVLGMMWLWLEKPDAKLMADYVESTLWFVLPSVPMFLLIPAMLRHGLPFWPTLVTGCLLTVALYSLMVWLGPKFGLKL